MGHGPAPPGGWAMSGLFFHGAGRAGAMSDFFEISGAGRTMSGFFEISAAGRAYSVLAARRSRAQIWARSGSENGPENDLFWRGHNVENTTKTKGLEAFRALQRVPFPGPIWDPSELGSERKFNQNPAGIEQN